MNTENDSTFIATLTTTGRVSGEKHSKMLKAVKHNDRIYFSRHQPNSDWFKNIIKEPAVTIMIRGEKHRGIATVIKDQNLIQRISELKYPDQQRAKERRVMVEVKLYELQ